MRASLPVDARSPSIPDRRRRSVFQVAVTVEIADPAVAVAETQRPAQSSSITHCGIHDAVGSGNDVAHGTGESGNGSPDAGRHGCNGAPDTAARRTDRARCTTVAAASAVAGRTCRAGAGLAV